MTNQNLNLCFDCKHRGSVPGSTHSRCKHPSIVPSDRGELLAMLSGGISIDLESVNKLGIKASAHGIASGWFSWPYNFDPVWLENCNGFQMIDEAVDKRAT